ncbi:MAG TPA: SGNH/GDSL hydrolase family protein [Bacillales bacterium]|nr:SGNH/GDSL hydrolase family protein [Bacillales bacterium]
MNKSTLLTGFAMIGFALMVIGLATAFTDQERNTGNREASGNWVAAWAASERAPLDEGISLGGFTNQTVRMIIDPHFDGLQLRLHLSNRYGTKPVTFSAVHVAKQKKGAAIQKNTDRTVTFDGETTVTIPPGNVAVSDAVSLRVNCDEPLAVSLYVRGESGPVTWHPHSLQTTYITPDGNHASDAAASAFTKKHVDWYWLNEIDVVPEGKVKGAIAVIGDSITNGNHSTINANRRWPDDLARRFHRQRPGTWSVINQGISANRIFESSPGIGLSAFDRLERDVFQPAGVKALIFSEGLNDIRHHPDEVDAEQMISAMKVIIEEAHEHGVAVYGATLTPFKGSNRYTEQGEKTREAVNQWIRTSGAFDGVIDFDKALRDPRHPKRLLPEYDHGDHFHPNDLGYQLMANVVDLSMFN